MSIMPVGLYLCLYENLLPQNCKASVSSVFRGIFGFLLAQSGFAPGKAKKDEKHRKGTLTDDSGSTPVSYLKSLMRKFLIWTQKK